MAYEKRISGGYRTINCRKGSTPRSGSKRVVVQVSDPNEEISLAEAQRLVPRAALGQTIDVDSSLIFNRIPTQTAKQVILQRIREAEHEHLYDQIKNWVGEIRLGILTRKDPVRGWLIDFDLDKSDKVEGVMPPSEEVPLERYRVGQRLRVYVYDVRRVQGRMLQIMVSRTHRDLVRRLFESEVPEIYEGTVEIKAIAREPGSRSKVAVVARQEGLDPIGSCVGVRGSRINNIVHELNDEKIDIIQWSADPATFVANSLSPVKPLKVELRDFDHTAIVTVPERQLSLAIGKDGQNARLAAKLSGWRVDVTKPVEGELYEERLDNVQEPAISSTARRERGDRYHQGRHERGERGESSSRRSGHHRGGGRHNSSYGYDEDRE